ncbi:MAG TPA: hypothetical protein VF086_10910 [Propionibacteriaceae bacterium]
MRTLAEFYRKLFGLEYRAGDEPGCRLLADRFVDLSCRQIPVGGAPQQLKDGLR